MPIYEYACEKCGHITEALRRMSDADAPQACEKCGHKKTVRQHSVFAAQGGGGNQELPMSPGACPMQPSGGGCGCCGGGHHHH